MKFKKLFTGFTLIVWAAISSADISLKPFQSDSLNQITEDRKGQPFILVLWSIDCPPCLKELFQLQQLRHQFSADRLVLVSTDDAQYADTVQQTITDFQLDQMDNWIFSESIPERLRYNIDPSWYGELPRAYFYESSHQRSAHSGSLKKITLNRWLKKTRINLSKDSQSNSYPKVSN